MKRLVSLNFDDMVPVHGWVTAQGGLNVARSNTFAASDGWTLFEVSDGKFSLQHTTMAQPAVVGGYGYSYVEQDVPVIPMPETSTRRKRGG